MAIVKYHLILTKLLHLLSPLPCLSFIKVSNKGASLWLVCCSSIFIRAPGAHGAPLSFTRHRYSLSLISRLMVMAFDGLACREWVSVRPAGPVPFCNVLLTLFPFFVPVPLPFPTTLSAGSSRFKLNFNLPSMQTSLAFDAPQFQALVGTLRARAMCLSDVNLCLHPIEMAACKPPSGR